MLYLLYPSGARTSTHGPITKHDMDGKTTPTVEGDLSEVFPSAPVDPEDILCPKQEYHNPTEAGQGFHNYPESDRGHDNLSFTAEVDRSAVDPSKLKDSVEEASKLTSF